MLKRLSIILLTILMVVPAMAQPQEGCECMYAPKKGQWQINLALGNGQFFNDASGLFYLLPNADGSAMGISFINDDFQETAGLGNNYISADLSSYVLNTGSLNFNSLTNIIGVQGKYFLTNHIDLNLMVAYKANLQPSKNYIEGVNTGLGYLNGMQDGNYDPTAPVNQVGVGDVYSQKAILGAVTHSLFTQIGADWYFDVKNPRIHPYVGVFGQFKLARVEAFYPYTGQAIYDEDLADAGQLKYTDIDVYRTNYRAGQVFGFGGGLTTGVEYSLSEGLIIGLEVAPVAYQYSLMQLTMNDQDPYYAANHNITAFAFPQLKFGIRF